MKSSKYILLGALFCLSLSFISACSQSEEGTTLRILNMEDYIYLYEGEGDEDTVTPEEDKMDLIDQFARDMEAKHPEMGKISVIYTTTDTNETLYNEIKTGKAVYDIICPSDYMIQKLINDNLIEKLDKSLVPNYYGEDSDVCDYIKNQFGGIEAKNLKSGVTEKVDDYSVGYMWGTLGILYNPDYFDETIAEEIHDDVQTWDMLWDEKYQGTISIKNSMRDTYAVGILKAYEDDLRSYKESHTLDEYNKHLKEVFNSFDQESVDAVKDVLNTLKKNVFGLEVDSGKLDITTGKIGVNIAWSGDAIYSMELAADEDQTLYYSIPDLGSNVWFDGWVMPTRPNSQPRSENEKILAHEWLNYLCDPHVAKENMEYTGYTSFVGGEEVRDMIVDWYDARTSFLYTEIDGESYDIFYEDDNDEPVYLTIEDFDEAHNDAYNDKPLFYEKSNGEKVEFNDPLIEDEKVPLTYGDITIEKLLAHEDVKVVDDIKYFFGDYTFYSTSYLPFEGNESAGLDFFCQFPSEKTIKRCAVMAYDYKNNDRVVKMWEDFKSDPLPIWAIILFALELLGIGAIVLYMLLNRRIKQKIRKNRLESK